MGSAGGTCSRDVFSGRLARCRGLRGEMKKMRLRDSQMQRSPFEEGGNEGVVTAGEGRSPRAGPAHEV